MVYIFYHVPKTAGTVLRYLLNAVYRNDLGLVYDNSTEIPLSKICYIGHRIRYGFHENIEGPASYIIFLRRPGPRAMSAYYHNVIKAYKATNTYPTVEEWLEGRTIPGTNTHSMVKAVANSLSEAKQVLEKTAFIGLQETFAADIAQLLPNIPIGTPQNVNVDKARLAGLTLPEITEAQHKPLASAFAEDEDLYAHALDLRARGHNSTFTLSTSY